jgi:tetratricopeptide (TPR) repeat protein
VLEIKCGNRPKNTKIVVALLLSTFLSAPLLASPFDLNITDPEVLETYTVVRDQRIKNEPNNPTPYIERGDARFLAHNFDEAVEDYTAALKLDDSLNEAYLGRGVALARAGWVQEGIEDLDVYIKRNPKSSLAYTKRGVRHLWLGDEDKAKADFENALKIDPTNAEAHDDIGVIFAKRQLYYQAADHFMSAFEIDPTYQKAYYNMALISYITDKDQLELKFVYNALALSPSSRNALILKAKILEAMGHLNKAQEIMDVADFLPEANWSEQVPIQ